jgi:hypothetical protein
MKYPLAMILLLLTACAVAQNSGKIVVDGIDPAGSTLDHHRHAMIRDTQNNTTHMIECNPRYTDCRALALGGRYSIAILPDNARGSYRNEISLRVTGDHFSAVYYYGFKIKD